MHLEDWTNTFYNLANGKESGSELEIGINPFGTNTFINLDKCICKFGQTHLSIWTNTFINWDKESNTFNNFDKCIRKFGQIHFAISLMAKNLDLSWKVKWTHFIQIHLSIWTYTFNLYKCIWKFGQIHFAISLMANNLDLSWEVK